MNKISVESSVHGGAGTLASLVELREYRFEETLHLASNLRLWLRSVVQRSGVTGVVALEIVLRLLVLRRWALLVSDDASLSVVGEEIAKRFLDAHQIWRMIVGTGQGMTQVIEKQMEQLEQKSGSPGLLASTLGCPWGSIPERDLRLLVDYLDNLGKFEALNPVNVSDFLLPQLLAEWQGLETRSFRAIFLSQSLAHLMVRLLALNSGVHIYDPFAGIGQLLRAALQAGRDNTQQGYGQLAAPDLGGIARLISLLLDIKSIHWFEGDILEFLGSNPSDTELQFERIISALPYLPQGVPLWDKFQYRNRFPYGIPTNSESDGLYVQLALSSLKPQGRAVLLVTTGFLFRQSARFIRQGLIEQDVIRAIVCLPMQAIRMTDRATPPMVLLVLERDKPPAFQGRLQLIDARDLPVNSQQEFEIDSIVSMVMTDDTVTIQETVTESIPICSWVSTADCQNEAYNLNPPLYLIKQQVVISQEANLRQLIEAEVCRRETQEVLDQGLRRLGWSLPSEF